MTQSANELAGRLRIEASASEELDPTDSSVAVMRQAAAALDRLLQPAPDDSEAMSDLNLAIGEIEFILPALGAGDYRVKQVFEQALRAMRRLSAPAGDGRDEIETFQSRVLPWILETFGPEIPFDKVERCDRFIEEALELIQASGYSKDRAHALVDYVFNRPAGELYQEVGGVAVTLAAFCIAHKIDLQDAAETELARVWTKVEQIRAKQAAKPTGSALPVASTPALGVSEAAVEAAARTLCRVYALKCYPKDADENTFPSLKREVDNCWQDYVERVEIVLLAAAPHMRSGAESELVRALNPKLWTREMSDAWHRNIPDTEKAFAALREIAIRNAEQGGEG